jgi:nucleoid-associated protein YgaU
MTLTKLTITPFKKQGERLERDTQKVIEVLFNPNAYSITKSVTWSAPSSTEGNAGSNSQVNAPTLTFGGGGSRHLTLELFFDVTESVTRNGQSMSRANDVRSLTDKVVALTRIDPDQHQPPVCEVMWGSETTKDFPFIGVIGSLTQRFTLFNENGSPVRAILTVDFTEFLDPANDRRQTDPEQTTHIVKRGETLGSIAGELYHNPALWRIIAEANNVDNPRQLIVGQTLTIPKYGRG